MWLDQYGTTWSQIVPVSYNTPDYTPINSLEFVHSYHSLLEGVEMYARVNHLSHQAITVPFTSCFLSFPL